MANLPYYSDPYFIQKAMQMLPGGQSFSSPFSATSRNVMAALNARREQSLANQMALENASASRNAALFDYGQNWSRYGSRMARGAQGIQAAEQIAYQQRLEELRRAAERKSRRRGIAGAVSGAIGGAVGSMVGGPVGGYIGQGAGQGQSF